MVCFVNLHPKVIYSGYVFIELFLINIFVTISSEILAQIITPIIFADTEMTTYF